MKWTEKMRLVLHLLRWRVSWRNHALDYLPPQVDKEKFITARAAAKLIPDGACIFSSGIAGNARCSIFFYALRDRFLREGHPSALTWINCGAQGSRGRVPGTIEEIGLPGLMKRYITAHMETAKAQLKLGQGGKLELYVLPQGIISLLLEEQGKGGDSLPSEVGLNTFLDPKFGSGPGLTKSAKEQYVVREKERLRYTIPQAEFALFSAPYADKVGNVYFKNAATITENLQSIRSVKRRGGKVVVAVANFIAQDQAAISVPAQDVDYIVVNPFNEQTVSVPQNRFWSLFTPEYAGDIRAAEDRLKFINTLLKITPIRSAVDEQMARLAAKIFVDIVPPGGLVNIGVGFPEEVARIVIENGLEDKFVFSTEAGAYGGLPAPGIFFGAAIAPRHLESSATMFTRYHRGLDMAVLGFLEVDSEGNVNVSRRGDTITDYVGPGGFPDIVYGARNIIFIGHWMQGAVFEANGGNVSLKKAGKPKFVRQVREVTFNGREALKREKRVWYVTNVGYFQLTERGLELRGIFPGIDLDNDILANSEAVIYPPSDEPIPVVNLPARLTSDKEVLL